MRAVLETETTDQRERPLAGSRPAPVWLWLGVGLIAVAWPVAWFGARPFSDYTFFPLWLGYILTVDGLTRWRSEDSPLARDGRMFGVLFLFSLPLWWLFEFANGYLGNWQYLTPREYGPVAYTALASLAFSTVMPAIFVTAAFWRTVPLLSRARHGWRLVPSRGGLMTVAALGLAMFVASLVVPDDAFPLVWIGVFLFLDPLNALAGGKSLTAEVAVGRWDTVLTLFAAGLTCGFFWEMWNWQSMPKWVYDVPHVGGLKVFEMPILGYGGYFPFALEVYAVYHTLHGLLFRRRDRYVRFDARAIVGPRTEGDKSLASAPVHPAPPA